MAHTRAILAMVAISLGSTAATADPLFRQLEPFSGIDRNGRYILFESLILVYWTFKSQRCVQEYVGSVIKVN